MQTITHADPHQTVRKALPYKFSLLMDGRVVIHNLRGQILTVSRSEMERILLRDDLDVHRRRMYEAAMEYLKKSQ